MNTTFKFMQWAWELGIGTEIGFNTFYQADYGDYKVTLLVLTCRYQDKHSRHEFRDWNDLEDMLHSGHATKIAQELLVPEFKP